MNKTKAPGLARKLTPLGAGAVALALMISGGCSGGCSKEEAPPAEETPPVSVGERLEKDTVYQGKVRALETEQGEIMQRGYDIRKKIEAAKEAGNAAEEARLQAELEKVAKQMEASRQKAAEVIRERIRQAQAEKKIYEQKHAQQQKGK